MNRAKYCLILLAALLLLPESSTVHAQWVMAARAVKNRIQRLSQQSGNNGYDVATVILDAAATNVYEKALKSIQAHSDITITKQDPKTGRIEFHKGKQVAGLQISSLDDKLTQLVVASSVNPDQSSATPLVVDAVLRVCNEVNVKCTVEPN